MYYDVVIIGSGASGLSSALNIDINLNVLVLSKDVISGSNTSLAQGGIAATLSKSERDINAHLVDTLTAGSYQNNKTVTKTMIEDSQRAIDFLQNCGVQFDMNGNSYDQTMEGGHNKRRILHCKGDQTGRVIQDCLLKACNDTSNITIIDNASVQRAESFFNNEIKVSYAHDNKMYSIVTNNLIIACGGYAKLFNCSTNSKPQTGTNLLLASDLHLAVADLHLVQFHPTGFKDLNGCYHLLTEALRGEGARFYTKEEGYFMDNIHPLGSLAPRDVTSVAVYKQITKGNVVYLDCSSMKDCNFNERFPTVANILKINDLSFTDLIPITPVAHYSIGGIVINSEGETNVEGVYACGEAAVSGVHGANRLASNSLLECVVFGMRVGKCIKPKQRYKIYEEDTFQCISPGFGLNKISDILSNGCNILRNDEQLKSALIQLDEIDAKECDIRYVKIAKNIIEMAIKNESIGCHYKESYE